ncbi:hypothetical protein HRI_002807900 [Hibiscus trionum]|uniref:Uncharacterized protein n=1 Tax=Hibiscus trionum TaxID=183268 RepID=A0A9W7M8J8_HIBTR|nr:hypothetical protein HRI_002807900 [Hibiscus trionum]
MGIICKVLKFYTVIEILSYGADNVYLYQHRYKNLAKPFLTFFWPEKSKNTLMSDNKGKTKYLLQSNPTLILYRTFALGFRMI